MRRLDGRAASLVAVLLLAGCASVGRPAGVQRMYVLECGENRTGDVSAWSPGVNVGQPRTFSNNCYLIQHGTEWMLWDTGNSDAINAQPDGVSAAGGRLDVRMPKTLASQLQALGVAPAQIKHLAFSHMHPDHCGNGNLFTAATLYMQDAEYDAAFGPESQKFNFNPATYEKLRGNPVNRLTGDHDVFGDGSVVIKSTPGHTIGHQSLLVRLPRQGLVILSGDLVHFQDNWVNKRVPSFNYNRDQSLASMQTIDLLMKGMGAQLWINHDKERSDRMPRPPAFAE